MTLLFTFFSDQPKNTDQILAFQTSEDPIVSTYLQSLFK